MIVTRCAALISFYNVVYFLQKLLSADQSGQRILFTGRSRLVSIFYHDLTSKTQLSPLPSRSLSFFFCRHTNKKRLPLYGGKRSIIHYIYRQNKLEAKQIFSFCALAILFL
jgi:hypothetical protein